MFSYISSRFRKNNRLQHDFFINLSHCGTFLSTSALLLTVLVALTTTAMILHVSSRVLQTPTFEEFQQPRRNATTFFKLQPLQENKGGEVEEIPLTAQSSPEWRHSVPAGVGPHHDWELFEVDYREMLRSLKIFVYPDVSNNDSAYANIFLPHPNPTNPKLGNYYSEHAFKVALLHSPFVTHRPEEANFFYMPFSINAMRNDPRLRSDSEVAISEFVANYTTNISAQYKFWNASGGADHFFAFCHSVGREATSKHQQLRNNAIQVTCSSSYFQKLYSAHKDVAMPQVWPRREEGVLNPPEARKRLVFYAGRIQNARIRQTLQSLWGNDTTMDIFSWNSPFPYEEGFRRSRYCLQVKGYEVNTARVSDAIHYGCVPVIISNHYDLPLANVLDWSKFSIVINEADVANLKNILLSVPKQLYLSMYQNLSFVRKHFSWYTVPQNYDSFYMTMYQLWLRRGINRLHY